jgi:SAM-dependent methyltransferase
MAILSDQKEAAERRDALVERLFGAMLGFFDLHAVYLGERLGFYHALNETGAGTAAQLAAATGTDERYVREWLEQQAVTGLLEVDDAAAPAEERRFRIPAGHDEVLLDRDSLYYLAPLGQMAAATSQPFPRLVEAFRTGDGIPYADFGREFHEGQGRINRPAFVNLLGNEWLPSIPEVHERLLADPPARIADVGCGTAWSSIAIARAYPKATVHALDLDESSLELARANVADAGVGDRVLCELKDAADPSLEHRYDLVTIFEALHDMSRPVEALRAARAMLAEGGRVLVMDERVAEAFTAPGDDVERFMYGWSILHCLPVGLAERPSAATGTVMRPHTVRAYATEAGFAAVEVLPIENDFFRFYLLRP